MKIAVVAASGKAGRKIVAEAAARGFEVTAFVRRATEIDGAAKVVVKDILALEKSDLENFDAVVDAFGAWTPETLPLHTTTSQHLCDLLNGTDTRLLIVGGAGSLYVDKEHTTQVFKTPEFPADYFPTAQAQANELDELRKRNDVKWTFVSPAADFQADGERTGKYLVGGEELTLNAAGESVISYADYALAMVDEISGGEHIKQRICFVKA
ncbi:MAG: NAD(P)-dependent oxidoreductase [Selenomonadaceae bacterium]|nr:NAD(P)-dependent oxidoreductase [Selenomonadaceae bacterium]